jgi:hypothetical protein
MGKRRASQPIHETTTKEQMIAGNSSGVAKPANDDDDHLSDDSGEPAVHVDEEKATRV